jgi:hypothetical protein
MEKENFGSQQPDVLGHKPLEYRDGKFFNSEGKEAHTNFAVGPQDSQKQVFIEYERTFGRGIAFSVTHGLSDAPVGVDSRQARLDYRDLINIAQKAMQNGTEEDCEQAISDLRQYRSRYPELYSDAKQEGPQKKFEINND